MRKYLKELIKRLEAIRIYNGEHINIREQQELIESLKNGSYKPKPAKRIELKKGRVVWKGTLLDNLVEKLMSRIVIDVLGENYFLRGVMGYVEGRGSQDVFKRIKEEYKDVTYVIKTDIKDHFGSIVLKDLEKELIKILGDGHFIQLIWKILRGRDESAKKKRKKGIAQGGVLSPLFANIYMKEVDEELEKLEGIKVIRYGDDFFIGTTGTKKEAETILKKVKEILGKKQLKINKKKTSIVKGEEGIKYLGVTVNINPEGVRLSGNVDNIIRRLTEKGFITADGRGKKKEEFTNMTEEEIFKTYNQVLNEHTIYYKECTNYVGMRVKINRILDESRRKTEYAL